MAAKAGQRKGPPPRRRGDGRRRLWVVVFAAVLVAIFVIFAVAQGIGAPSVPSGDAVLVQGLPSGENTMSEAEVKRVTAQRIAAAKSEGTKKAPKPGSKKFKELEEAGIEEVVNFMWLRGEAEELNISATSKQIEEELKKIKEQNFPTPKAFKEFLEETKLTPAEVNDRVEQQVLVTEIEERIKSEAPVPTSAEIEAYYEKEKAAQFTTPASRDVRIIVNKDESKVEAAQKALEADQSPASWKKVAAEYSSDPTTKNKGGLQQQITEEFVKGELKKAIFDSATGELIGPLEYQKNFLLIEPVKLNPEKSKSLAEVRSQISQTLQSQVQEEFFGEFVTAYQSKWSSRTICASGYEVKLCSNYRGTGHPSSASPACYEADPKAPAKECPAPVTMTTPAIPGTVTEDEPKGQRLVQRPRPAGLKEASAEEGALPEGVAPEGTPPPEAAPEE